MADEEEPASSKTRLGEEEEEEEHEDLKTLLKKNKNKKEKLRERLLKQKARLERRGVCYLSRVPPQMDPLKLRQILSQYGEILRIYLVPEDPAARVRRKTSGGHRAQQFAEGWVEFARKSVAKKVAHVLNGEQIGGKKRSKFYFDLWNIKYLSSFKWDDLTDEIATKNAEREQKMQLEISTAKKERDFYLSKVDQSRALHAIQERANKRQRISEDVGDSIGSIGNKDAKIVRQFSQMPPVMEKEEQRGSRLSRDTLSKIFGNSSP